MLVEGEGVEGGVLSYRDRLCYHGLVDWQERRGGEEQRRRGEKKRREERQESIKLYGADFLWFPWDGMGWIHSFYSITGSRIIG